MNGKLLALLAAVLMVTTGCIFGKKSGGPPPDINVSQAEYPKVLLKLSGPADWPEGRDNVTKALMKIPYVIDASVNNRFFGTVIIHLSPNAVYDIKDFQKACKSAGYDVTRAAEISW